MAPRGRPGADEANAYYAGYIGQVPGDDVMAVLERQLEEARATLDGITEAGSRHRYAEGKWSLRELLSHVSDVERLFAFRALWFARGLDTPLPGFDENAAVAASGADGVPWSAHRAELAAVRAATLELLRNLPEEAWMRRGSASGFPFTVRAIAFITAGHAAHHLRVIRERYLPAR